MILISDDYIELQQFGGSPWLGIRLASQVYSRVKRLTAYYAVAWDCHQIFYLLSWKGRVPAPKERQRAHHTQPSVSSVETPAWISQKALSCGAGGVRQGICSQSLLKQVSK